MKYKAGVILYANFTINADSEDDAHDKMRDLATDVEWFVASHPERDTTLGKIIVSEIEIIDVEEVT